MYAATLFLCHPLSMQKGGTKPLWEELYEDHYKELVAFGSRISGSKELAEDLTQETFVRALMNGETVMELSPSKRRAWLYRTFKNLFFDRYRRLLLENEYTQNLQPESVEDPGIQRIENAMVLQGISVQDRTIFQLRYFDGYSAQEISQMLNLPPGTIRSRLSRCRKYLKQNLDG
jgi:RNA polymerase sigma-70 factor (ECF subfamily)